MGWLLSEYRKPSVNEELTRQKNSAVQSTPKASFGSYEMFVVVGIVLLLAGLLFPFAKGFKDRADTARVEANAKTVGIVVRYVLMTEDISNQDLWAFAAKYKSWQSTEALNGDLKLEKAIANGVGKSGADIDVKAASEGGSDSVSISVVKPSSLAKYIKFEFDSNFKPKKVYLSDTKDDKTAILAVVN